MGCILYALCYFKSPFDAVYERGDSVALAVMSAHVTFPDDNLYNEVGIYNISIKKHVTCILQWLPLKETFLLGYAKFNPVHVESQSNGTSIYLQCNRKCTRCYNEIGS